MLSPYRTKASPADLYASQTTPDHYRLPANFMFTINRNKFNVNFCWIFLLLPCKHLITHQYLPTCFMSHFCLTIILKNNSNILDYHLIYKDQSLCVRLKFLKKVSFHIHSGPYHLEHSLGVN